MRYTDLIFDLYGTLVDIHTDENEEVWEKTALYYSFHGAAYTGEELSWKYCVLYALYAAAHCDDNERYPEISTEEIMEDLFIERGIIENTKELASNAAQLFRILSIDYIRLYPHAVDALKKLREMGCRLWLLSNAQAVFTSHELRALGIDELFEGIYISSDIGYGKPSRRFFKALTDGNKLDLSKCLMIGNDRQTDIAGAQAMGIDSLYMHTALTPEYQKPADPRLHPARCSSSPYEYEGNDWSELSELLCSLILEDKQ